MTIQTNCHAKNPETCRYHGSYTLQILPMDPETHKTDSEKLMFFLDTKEKSALASYVDQDYTEINACLYGAFSPDDETDQKIKAIDSALSKYRNLNTGEVRTTYRATKSYMDFSSKEDAKKWVEDNFPVGQEVTLPGFTSTTPNPCALFDFLPESVDELKPNIGSLPWQQPDMDSWEAHKTRKKNHGLSNLIFVMKSKSGVPVSSYGQMFAVKEQEYLHPRDSTFTVEKVEHYRRVKNPDPYHRREAAYATIITLTED